MMTRAKTHKPRAKRYRASEAIPVRLFALPKIDSRDLSYFQILDISASGMKLSCFLDRCPELGNTFFGYISYNQQHLSCRFKVIWTENLLNQNRARLGVKIIEKDAKFTVEVSKYLADSSPSLSQIRQQGILKKTPKNSLIIRTACGAPDMKGVASIRREAYLNRQSVSDKAKSKNWNLEMFLDDWDKRAKVIVAEQNGEIVGSIRCVFAQKDQSLEIEDYFKSPNLAACNSKVAEFSKLCISPEKTNRIEILTALYTESFFASFELGKTIVVGSATDELMPLYKGIGFNITNQVCWFHEAWAQPKDPKVRVTLIWFDLAEIKALIIAEHNKRTSTRKII